MTQEQLIQRFSLLPHPEGGYYCETYRSAWNVPGHQANTIRSAATGIYFMLTAGNFSALHRIQSDEMWHFYYGDAIEVVEITLNGEWKTTRLGNNIAAGEVPQYVVKAGHWFGSCVVPEGAFGLVGCTVSPGFDFNDFNLGDRNELCSMYPTLSTLITTWTRT